MKPWLIYAQKKASYQSNKQRMSINIGTIENSGAYVCPLGSTGWDIWRRSTRPLISEPLA